MNGSRLFGRSAALGGFPGRAISDAHALFEASRHSGTRSLQAINGVATSSDWRRHRVSNGALAGSAIEPPVRLTLYDTWGNEATK